MHIQEFDFEFWISNNTFAYISVCYVYWNTEKMMIVHTKVKTTMHLMVRNVFVCMCVSGACKIAM